MICMFDSIRNLRNALLPWFRWSNIHHNHAFIQVFFIHHAFTTKPATETS